MKVNTPTTAAAIHAPCQSDIEISLTLETSFGKPIPETSSDLSEQPLRKAVARNAPRRPARVRFLGADIALRIVAQALRLRSKRYRSSGGSPHR
jgi:hypothetical protein